MTPPRQCRWTLVASLTLGASPALAAEVEVTSSSVFQGYDVGYRDQPAIERWRYTQSAGLSIENLQGDPASETRFAVRLMLRADTDFGVDQAETDWTLAASTRYIPGIETARLDLMYGYVEARFLKDAVVVTLGRQLTIDALGLWCFDGGAVRVATPFFVTAEVLGGLEERGGLPLSTSRYERSGVWRGGHSDFDLNGREGPRNEDFPSFQPASPAPAIGAAIETPRSLWGHARLAYRRVYNTGTVFTDPFPAQDAVVPTVSGLRLSSDRIGASGSLAVPGIASFQGALAYDLFAQTLSSARGQFEVTPARWLRLSGSAEHVAPVYDADSIFNWFTHFPSTTGLVRVSATPSRGLTFEGSGGTRVWATSGDPATFTESQCRALQAPEARSRCESRSTGEGYFELLEASRDEALRATTFHPDALGTAVIRLRNSLAELTLRGSLQWGAERRLVGLDVAGERRFDSGRFAIHARTTVAQSATMEYTGVDPALGVTVPITTGTYVLGARYRPIADTAMSTDWEHSFGLDQRSRFRVLARLDVAFSP